MKLILTSTGLANKKIKHHFLQIINKPVSQIKIIFVPTASRSKEELKYVDKSKRELLDLGILENNIKTLNLDKPVSFQEVEDFDVIYVCGGNTFYLLKKVRETGFDKIIKEFLKKDKLYFGVSAGSILVCPNIDIAIPFDDNDVNLTDLKGLDLIKIIVFPHYKDEEKRIINDFRKKLNYEIIPLKDSQALLFLEEKIKILE